MNNVSIEVKQTTKKRTGFTLIEVMVTMAITAILTTIVFRGFSQEKKRTAVKQTADQLQIDLQDVQSRTQSGVVASGLTTPPSGNGIMFTTSTPTTYTVFADVATGVPSVGNNLWDGVASADKQVGVKNLTNNIQIQSLSTDLGTATRLDIVYSGIRGDAVIMRNSTCCSNTATITLKNTSLGLCYSVSVQKTGGVVTKKQYSGSC